MEQYFEVYDTTIRNITDVIDEGGGIYSCTLELKLGDEPWETVNYGVIPNDTMETGQWVYAQIQEGISNGSIIPGLPDVTKLKEALVGEVKREAGKKIVEDLNLPQWKQANITARGIELMNKARITTLTAEEETEITNLKNVWEKIQEIRVASDQIEAEILASSDPKTVEIQGHILWPVIV